MKKITIIALHLGYGGIEKAIASLANMLCKDYKVNIISTYKVFDKPAFYIDNKVKIEYLIDDKPNKKEFLESLKKGNILSLLKETIKSIKVLRLRKQCMINAIKKIDSDVVISTRAFHNTLLGKYAKPGLKKIAWEHSHHNNNKQYINKLIKSCKNMDYLVSVSKELNDFYKKEIKTTKCRYISLALDDLPIEVSKLKTKEIISVGRLSKEKGFESLIEVFKLVNDRHPDWHLNIVGDGLEKDNISKKIKQLELSKNITMYGFMEKDKVNDILKNSSIYVMTSYTESFGLVLIEAMSYGVPCISFDSARGSLEIIDNNKNGFIIKNRDINKMAEKIIALIDDAKLRKKLGQRAYEKSLLYSSENVKKEWISLIEGKSK
ncbi:MAG: glycosyltransferase [Bacilli bacterium]|nr:glycosyltransferase [Bacilli bacterium]MDD3304955.1 glycosyltransferase [Bacilli bacterium]MDD4054067.1 glycosyltransferase [Bacilli bacterium]MDD4411412.1 glycosyltransferase [Bacilli bacterium]